MSVLCGCVSVCVCVCARIIAATIHKNRGGPDVPPAADRPRPPSASSGAGDSQPPPDHSYKRFLFCIVYRYKFTLIIITFNKSDFLLLCYLIYRSFNN